MRFLRSSAAADRIETPGTYELLAALQHDAEVTAAVTEARDPRRQRALAATVVAFVRADLLVGCEDGLIAAVADTGEGTVVAATDTEAAEAYLGALTGLPRAERLAFLPLTEATGESPSQAVWLGVMHRHGADHVVVNPAGPAGSARFDRTVVRDLAPLLPKIRPPHIDRHWREHAWRSVERERLDGAVRRLAGVARGDDPGSFAAARDHEQGLLSFNSPLVTDTVRYLEGLARLGAGEDGTAGAISAAVSGARDGFPEHCVDAILEVSGHLTRRVATSAEELQPLIEAKRALEGLLHAGLQWRAGEAEACIAELARAIAAATVSGP